jgi:hypothetical protein
MIELANGLDRLLQLLVIVEPAANLGNPFAPHAELARPSARIAYRQNEDPVPFTAHTFWTVFGKGHRSQYCLPPAGPQSVRPCSFPPIRRFYSKGQDDPILRREVASHQKWAWQLRLSRGQLETGLIPIVVGVDPSAGSWPGLSRPSMSLI